MRLVANCVKRRYQDATYQHMLRKIGKSTLVLQRMQEHKCKDKVNPCMNQFIVRKKFNRRNLLARYAGLNEYRNRANNRR